MDEAKIPENPLPQKEPVAASDVSPAPAETPPVKKEPPAATDAAPAPGEMRPHSERAASTHRCRPSGHRP